MEEKQNQKETSLTNGTLDTSEYTGLTLEELREKMSGVNEARKHEPTEEQKENASAYGRLLIQRPHGDKQPRNLEEAMEAFNKTYGGQRLIDKPHLTYDDSKVLWWNILHRLNQGKPPIFEDDNRNAYIDLIKYFIADESGSLDLNKGIYLWGNVGRGKTFIMKAIQAMLGIMEYKPRQFNIISCRDIVFDVSAQKDISIMNKYFSGSYLFEDLGYEEQHVKLWGNDTSIMEEILITRYDYFTRHRTNYTHCTTNVPPERMKEYYKSNRLDSRMYEMFNFVELKGADKRKTFEPSLSKQLNHLRI